MAAEGEVCKEGRRIVFSDNEEDTSSSNEEEEERDTFSHDAAIPIKQEQLDRMSCTMLRSWFIKQMEFNVTLSSLPTQKRFGLPYLAKLLLSQDKCIAALWIHGVRLRNTLPKDTWFALLSSSTLLKRRERCTINEGFRLLGVWTVQCIMQEHPEYLIAPPRAIEHLCAASTIILR